MSKNIKTIYRVETEYGSIRTTNRRKAAKHSKDGKTVNAVTFNNDR